MKVLYTVAFLFLNHFDYSFFFFFNILYYLVYYKYLNILSVGNYIFFFKCLHNNVIRRICHESICYNAKTFKKYFKIGLYAKYI